MKKYSLLGFLCLLSGTLFAVAERDSMSEAFDVLSQAVTLKPGAILTQDNFPRAIQLLSGHLRTRYHLPQVPLISSDLSKLIPRDVGSLQQSGAECGLYACFNMGLFMQEARREKIKNSKADFDAFWQQYQNWIKFGAGRNANIAKGDDRGSYVSTQVVTGLFLDINGPDVAQKAHVLEYVTNGGENEGALLNQLSVARRDRNKDEGLCFRLQSLPVPEPGLFDERTFIQEWYQFFINPVSAEPIYCMVTNSTRSGANIHGGHFIAIKFYKQQNAAGVYQAHAAIRDSLGYHPGHAQFIFEVMRDLFYSGQLKKYYDATKNIKFEIEFPEDQSLLDYLQILQTFDLKEQSTTMTDILGTIIDISRAPDFWSLDKDSNQRIFHCYFYNKSNPVRERISIQFYAEGESPLFVTDKEDTEWAGNIKDILLHLYNKVLDHMNDQSCS